MQYSEKLKNSIRGLFLIDFKNAIDNQYFLIQKNGKLVIYPRDKKMKKYLNMEDLHDHPLQVIAILNVMIDWSNGAVTFVDERTTGLCLVQDLVNQVKLLDDKLNKLA